MEIRLFKIEDAIETAQVIAESILKVRHACLIH